MTFSLDQWHKRYKQQAKWTYNIRNYIYERVNLQNNTVILDIGCGTGVLMQELIGKNFSNVIGIDIDNKPLNFANGLLNHPKLICGDALKLPIKTRSINVCLCHFLLLWLANPLQSLQEMVRVTYPGGHILALAEPDYGGRIDFPSALEQIGHWQTEALKKQGANPQIGRELRSLFSQSGLMDIEVGVLGGQWVGSENDDDIDLEWNVIHSDVETKQQYRSEFDEIREIDKESRRNNTRILFVPTFYAFGRVKE